ncbi:5773_t:CDS:2 [Ambispora leptoticha]|uniref:5773_t:CDS:1 n=1 Tax=Ambispora leptoticha TaxID=144679 RepID=A0A9N8V1A3_9GLOM|nr:5773_t:CDS:2 [Ambispora leptoticha]
MQDTIQTPAPTPPPPIQPAIQPAPQTQQVTMPPQVPVASQVSLSSRTTIHPQSQQVRGLSQNGVRPQIATRTPTSPISHSRQSVVPIQTVQVAQSYTADSRIQPSMSNGAVSPTTQRPSFSPYIGRSLQVASSPNSRPSTVATSNNSPISTLVNNSHSTQNSHPPRSPILQNGQSSSSSSSPPQILQANHHAQPNIQVPPSQQSQPRALTPAVNLTQTQLSRPSTPQQRHSHLPSTSSPQLLASSSLTSPVPVTAAAKVLEWAASQNGVDHHEPEELTRYIKQEPIEVSGSQLLSQYHDHEYEDEDEMMEPMLDMRIKREHTDDEDSSSKEEIGFTPHNRGNKLKRRAEALNGGPKLKAPYGYHEDLEYIDPPSGKRRHIIYRIPQSSETLLPFSGDEEDNPYKEVSIKDILGPLETPEDIIRRPALKRVLKDLRLNKLAQQFSQMIEDEHRYNKILTRLYNILQGDDPMYQDLDFRINPLPETVTTRVSKTEKSEGGSGFGVLNMGLQGNESIKGKRALEGKDDGLETLKEIREKLLEQLDYSGQFLTKLTSARAGIVGACKQKERLYIRMKEREKMMRENHNSTFTSSSSTHELNNHQQPNPSSSTVQNSTSTTTVNTSSQHKDRRNTKTKGKRRAK